MPSVVIDTNVIISATLSGKGQPSQIVELLSAGVLRLYYSVEILDEYTEVLARAKFNFKIIIGTVIEKNLVISFA